MLWHPADFLHTQREGWQLDFHLGQMSFFNHVTLGPSQLREAQPVRTHGGQCPGSARGCTLLLPKALRPAHGALSPWTRLRLIPWHCLLKIINKKEKASQGLSLVWRNEAVEGKSACGTQERTGSHPRNFTTQLKSSARATAGPWSQPHGCRSSGVCSRGSPTLWVLPVCFVNYQRLTPHPNSSNHIHLDSKKRKREVSPCHLQNTADSQFLAYSRRH